MTTKVKNGLTEIEAKIENFADGSAMILHLYKGDEFLEIWFDSENKLCVGLERGIGQEYDEVYFDEDVNPKHVNKKLREFLGD